MPHTLSPGESELAAPVCVCVRMLTKFLVALG